MNTKKIRLFTLFILLCGLICIVSLPVAAQKIPQPTQQVPPKGEFSYLDGRGNFLADTDRLMCGQASGNRGYYYEGRSHRIEVSFGLIPPDGRIANAAASVFGSWNVRSYVGADATRPETISAYFFEGTFTHGTILDAPGGGQVYDIYGTTVYTGSACAARNGVADLTRRPVHIYGICGNNQEVNFDILSPLPTGLNRDESIIYASAIFMGGNITCGKTTDRRRVRTNLSR